MESENGVAAVEDGKHIIGVTSQENINKEDENDCNNSEIPCMNEASKPITDARGPNSDDAGIEAAAEAIPTSSVIEKSKRAKEPSAKGGVASKNNKSANKDKHNLKALTSLSLRQKPQFSKSLSFPAKSAGGDGIKKSIDAILVKSEAKHVDKDNQRRLTNSRNSNRRTSLASVSSLKRVAFGRSIPVNAVSKSLTSEAPLPVYQISNPGKTQKPNKEDDDAHSTTSSATPHRRSGSSEFSFRLEERAERREELLSKLEEKFHEKQAEKTSQQGKSKENQEVDMKQLRKRMTFKATPMPSFYKEPPPKVELKKIPTTRPMSPKFGRHKISALNNNSEDKSCSSPSEKQQQHDSSKAKIKGNKDVTSKKPIRKTQAKLQSKETTTRKTERKVSGINQHV